MVFEDTKSISYPYYFSTISDQKTRVHMPPDVSDILIISSDILCLQSDFTPSSVLCSCPYRHRRTIVMNGRMTSSKTMTRLCRA